MTLTEAIALPGPLIAVHRYKPSWFLFIFFNERTVLELRVFSSLLAFDHVIEGGGVPLA